MSKVLRKMVVAASAAAMLLGTLAVAAPASADSSAIKIGRYADRSATHLRVFVRVRVVCSPDTTDAWLSGEVEQTNPAGDTQYGEGALLSLSSFECSGAEERVLLPVRIPTGGYTWRAGAAAVRNICFTTTDPSGTYESFLKARTITIR
jgi:hypothetical protein